MTIELSTETSASEGDQHVARTAPPGPRAGNSSLGWHRTWSWARLLSGPLAAVVAIVVLMSGAVPVYTEFTIGLGAVYALMVLSLSMLASWTTLLPLTSPRASATPSSSPSPSWSSSSARRACSAARPS